MTKTIIVGGYGVGISNAVAEKFGAEGYAVALVARNAERVDAGAKALVARGIKAEGFVADLGDPAAVRAVVAKIRTTLPPIGIVQWTAYAPGAGDLTTADPAELRTAFDVAVTGLVAMVQAALPDLRETKGAVLVTNGGLSYLVPQLDTIAVQWGAMGLAIASAAKHKTVRLLAEKLRPDGIYVGEVVVNGSVKGTAFDSGNATLDASTVAAKFWAICQARTDLSVAVS
ncbi:MAG: SDR family NAD(P)-dependent oxidoreductase [Proteobacteria bacterium]|nr:SDR family NAD(P)-dependent oxidoreductase [Pseudomonadota bacterium]